MKMPWTMLQFLVLLVARSNSSFLQQQSCLSRFRSARAFNPRVQQNSISSITESSSVRLAADADTTTVATVVLKRTHQSKAFRSGNQLVFTKAIQSILPPASSSSATNTTSPGVADLVKVAVQGQHNNPVVVLGWGVYNPHSLYKVRFLCHKHLQPRLHKQVLEILSLTGDNDDGAATRAIQAMVRHHVQTALATRSMALNLPTRKEMPELGVYETNTYRLINGEGDGLSGLAVDIIDQVAVVMSSALWCQVHQNAIKLALQDCLPNHTIVWKTTPSRLQQDGADNNSMQSSLLQKSPQVLAENDRQVLSKENGVVFATYPFALGQKTGVYCDQRENRWHIATLSRNKRVLDLCCYHGGFSLTAVVRGGAASAVGVDSSDSAVAACRINAELNGCMEKVVFIRAEIEEFLKEQYLQQEQYDIVVLDPPKLAPSEKQLDKASRKYHSLNRDAIKVVSNSGGLLMSCTCSAAMTQQDGGQYFLNMVQGAALAAERQVTLLRVSGAASCHTESPIAWPSGKYLTAAVFYVHPV